jgi:hypothetical protein
MSRQREGRNFTTPHSLNQSTEQHQTSHIWWPRGSHQPRKFAYDRIRGSFVQRGEIMWIHEKKHSPLFSSSNPNLPVSMVRLLWLIRQATCSRTYLCLHKWNFSKPMLGGHLLPKPPIFPKSWWFATACENGRADRTNWQKVVGNGSNDVISWM